MDNTVQQWEYVARRIHGTTSQQIAISDFLKEINKMGENGWEFCGFYYNDAIFKRPKQLINE